MMSDVFKFNNPDAKSYAWLLQSSVWLLVLGGLYASRLYSYLLFHTLGELFSIIIACAIFMVYWNARAFIRNNYFLFIGIAYLFVGVIELFHLLSYSGMTIFRDYGINLPTQLWIAARYVQSLSLVLAPLFIKKTLRLDLALSFFAILLAVLFLSIFYWGIFPDCYVAGQGLTPFKIRSEYIICLLLVGALLLLIHHKQHFDRMVISLIAYSILLTIASEAMFSLYSHAYDLFNLMGHFIKIIAYWLIYKALLHIGLRQPYKLLFREIKQSEMRYYSLFSNMMDGYALHKMVYDADGHPVDYIFMAVNEAFEEMIGKTGKEMIGRPVTEVFPDIVEDSLDWIRTYAQVVSSGKPLRMEQYSEALGKWYDLVAYRSEEQHFVTIVQDITERKQAEMELKKAKTDLEARVGERTGELLKSKEVLELIIEHIPVMLCFFSPEGHLKLYNQAFENISLQTTGGANPVVANNRNCSLTRMLCEEVWQHITTPFSEWKDFTIPLKKGGFIETSWRTISCPENHTIAIGIDISDRKKIEWQLRESLQSLERSNRELQDFTYIASHDLHEPLRKIRTFGDILSLNFTQALDSEGRDYISRMQSAAERMQNLLDSLLAYSRLGTNKPTFAPVDLAEVVGEALSNLELLLSETGGRVNIKALPIVDGDRVQFVQLLQNIIGNALKFHRKDAPPVITITTRPPENESTETGSTVDIVIEDNGIGIEEKFVDRIFQPFQKLHAKQTYPGLGMGLAICQKIVRRHGGRIQVNSVPGRGSTFMITLPKHQTAP